VKYEKKYTLATRKNEKGKPKCDNRIALKERKDIHGTFKRRGTLEARITKSHKEIGEGKEN
jgi:hypothetical protein